MLFSRMGHVAIEVSDLERSMKFYRDLLGLEARWSKDADWANLKLGNDDLSLVKKSPGQIHPPHFGFRVKSREELKAAHEKLSTAGVSVEPISGHRDGSISFYFRDPDGNHLEAVWDPGLPA